MLAWADIGGLAVVESGSLLLILQGHAPLLASHFTVRGEMGLTRASLGKFDKGGVGLYGYAPDSARASVVGRQWQSIKISQSYQNFGVEEERSAARSAGQVAAIVPRRLTHHGPSAGRRRPFYLFIPRLVGERSRRARPQRRKQRQARALR